MNNELIPYPALYVPSDDDNFVLHERVSVTDELDTPPLFSKYRSRTGLTVYIANNKKKTISMNIVVKTRPESDAAEPRCLQHMIFEGCKKMDSPAGNEILGANGVRLQRSVVDNSSKFQYKASSQKGLLNALPYVMSYLKEPTLDRRSFLTGVYHVDGDNEEGGAVFNKDLGWTLGGSATIHQCLAQTLYKGTPYAHPSQAVVPTLRDLTLDQLKAYHKKYYTWDNMAVVVSGTVDEQAVLQALTDIENEIGPDPPSNRQDVIPPPITKTTVHHVQVPGPNSAPGSMRVFFSSKNNEPPIEHLMNIHVPLTVINQVLFSCNPASLVSGRLLSHGVVGHASASTDISGRVFRGCVFSGVGDMDAALEEGGRLLKDAPRHVTLEHIHSILRFEREKVFLRPATDGVVEEDVDVITEEFSGGGGPLWHHTSGYYDMLLSKPLEYWQGLMEKYFSDAPAFVLNVHPTEASVLIPPPKILDNRSLASCERDLIGASLYGSRDVSEGVRERLPSISSEDVRIPELRTYTNLEPHTVRGRPVKFFHTPTNEEEEEVQEAVNDIPVPMVVMDVGSSRYVHVLSHSRLPTPGELSHLSQEERELRFLALDLMPYLQMCSRIYEGKVMSSQEFTHMARQHVLHEMIETCGSQWNPFGIRASIKTTIEELPTAMKILESRRHLQLSDDVIRAIVSQGRASYSENRSLVAGAIHRLIFPDQRSVMTQGYAHSLLKKHGGNVSGIRNALQNLMEASFDPKSTCVFVTGAGKDITPETLKTIVEEGGYDIGKRAPAGSTLKDILRPVRVKKKLGHGEMLHIEEDPTRPPNMSILSYVSTSSKHAELCLAERFFSDPAINEDAAGVLDPLSRFGLCSGTDMRMVTESGLWSVKCENVMDVGQCMKALVHALGEFKKRGISDDEFKVLKNMTMLEGLEKYNSDLTMSDGVIESLVGFRRSNTLVCNVMETVPSVTKERFMEVANEVADSIINTVNQKQGFCVIDSGTEQGVKDSVTSLGYTYGRCMCPKTLEKWVSHGRAV